MQQLTYKEEFIRFMVENGVLRFGEFYAEKRPESPVFHQYGKLQDGGAARAFGGLLRGLRARQRLAGGYAGRTLHIREFPWRSLRR